MGAYERRGNHEHDWHYAGGQRDGRAGDWYTKWACPCGAYKIESMRIIQDDSGTFEIVGDSDA